MQTVIRNRLLNVRDTNIKPMDLRELWEHLESEGVFTLNKRLVVSSLANASGIPKMVDCFKLVVTYAKRYVPKTQEIGVVDGSVVIKVSAPKAVSQALGLPVDLPFEKISIAILDESFKEKEDWCKNSMAKTYLKFERKGNSQLPPKLKKTHFKDEIFNAITLLHHVIGNGDSESFEDWICLFIFKICDWGEIICHHFKEQLLNYHKCATFHMCSYLLFFVASQKNVWSGLEMQGALVLSMPIYKFVLQLTKWFGMENYHRVNDAFLMDTARRLEGKLEVCFSLDYMSLITRYGIFYI